MKRNFSLIILFFLSVISFLIANSESDQKPVYRIRIQDQIINPVVEKFIHQSMEEAVLNQATCLIIELDTPGGLLESTRKIVKELLNAPLPVAVYVSPSGSRAASAGVFITAAAHIAAMAPSTHIGAAHPVTIGGRNPDGENFPSTKENTSSEKPSNKSENQSQEFPDSKDKENDLKALDKEQKTQQNQEKKEKNVLSEKILQDTLAWISSISKARNRNEEWLRRAVAESISATAEEALELNVIDIISPSFENLLTQIDGKEIKIQDKTVKIKTENAPVVLLEMSFSQQVLNMISNPNIAYILMILGLIGLIFEFSHPGIGFPGIAGLICLLLAFFAFNTLPINSVGVVLILLSVILFIAEALTPTFGILTLGGIISLIIGSLMLIDSDYPLLRISLSLIISMAVFMAIISVFLVSRIFVAYKHPVKTGKEGLIGSEAITQSVLTPSGKVFCHGELWNAKSVNGERIEKNCEVEILELKGLTLIVKPKKS